jgi:RHS repeat-associated protein
MDRRSTSTTTSSAGTSTTTRYYEDTSDNPAWATTTTGGTTETSRYLSSIAGDLSVTQNVSTKTLSTGIIDPQGSVVATSYTHTPEVENGQAAAPVTMWSALESFDEYGNKLAASDTKTTGALNHAWLGGKERATDLSGLVLMGVRLYSSVTGQFTSVDPVKGGNTTVCAYPQDPINKFDLDGNAWEWAKRASRAITDSKWGRRIGTVCSFAWGGVGTACNAVYAGAYAVQGCYGRAASQFIPGGIGKIASKVVSKTVGKKITQKIWGRKVSTYYSQKTYKWAYRNGYTVRGVRKLGGDFRNVATYHTLRKVVTAPSRAVSRAAGTAAATAYSWGQGVSGLRRW